MILQAIGRLTVDAAPDSVGQLRSVPIDIYFLDVLITEVRSDDDIYTRDRGAIASDLGFKVVIEAGAVLQSTTLEDQGFPGFNTIVGILKCNQSFLTLFEGDVFFVLVSANYLITS